MCRCCQTRGSRGGDCIVALRVPALPTSLQFEMSSVTVQYLHADTDSTSQKGTGWKALHRIIWFSTFEKVSNKFVTCPDWLSWL